MKRLSLLTLFLVGIFTVACVSDNSTTTDETDLKPNQRSFPKGKREILKLVDNIQTNKDTMDKKGPRTIEVEGVNVEVTAYIANNSPVIIETKYPDKQEFYYLKDQQVMLLRELILGGESSSQVTENQFFYNQLELLDMETRSAIDAEALQNSSFKPIAEQGDDYRFEAEKVNRTAINFIYGQ